jgi:paraquat-inducible protein B
MSDENDPLSHLPSTQPAPARHHRLQLVWLVPVVAAILGIWIGVHSWLSTGPTIDISFRTAEGIEPGKTLVRYKNVNIGTVTALRFSKDGGVVLTALMAPDARPFLRKDSQFWVVRPRVSSGGISGLGTLFSGAYISFVAGSSPEQSLDFRGLEAPIVETEDVPGRIFVLHAADAGSLEVGSPLLFRRVRAGTVVSFEVDNDGRGVTLKVFVDSPYDHFVTSDTRFWHASGVDISLDSSGLRVQTQSAATILEGGLAFETPEDRPPAPPAAAQTRFELFRNHDEAMKKPYKDVHHYVVYFNESLRGLSPGAAVALHGITVGEVQGFGIEYDPKQHIFRFPVEVNVYTDMLRQRYVAGAPHAMDSTEAGQRDIVDHLVAAGMRAQLRSGNLVTAQLYIDLEFYPHAAPAKINWNTETPEMPSVSGGLDALTDTLGDIAQKIDKMPLDKIGVQLEAALAQLRSTLQSTTALVDHMDQQVTPELRSALVGAQQTLQTAQATLQLDSPLQSDLHDTLEQLSRAARALSELSDLLEQHPEALLRGKKENKE